MVCAEAFAGGRQRRFEPDSFARDCRWCREGVTLAIPPEGDALPGWKMARVVALGQAWQVRRHLCLKSMHHIVDEWIRSEQIPCRHRNHGVRLCCCSRVRPVHLLGMNWTLRSMRSGRNFRVCSACLRTPPHAMALALGGMLVKITIELGSLLQTAVWYITVAGLEQCARFSRESAHLTMESALVTTPEVRTELGLA